MRAKEFAYGRIITDALQTDAAHHVPASDDLWTRVLASTHRPGGAAASEHRQRRYRAGAILLACLAAGFVGLGVTAAASPPVRHLIAAPLTIVGITVDRGDTSVEAVTPPLPFHVLNPQYVPAGLTLREFSRLPGRANEWSASLLSGGASLSASPEREVTRLNAAGIDGVYLRFEAPPPGTGYVTIVEQATTGAPVPTSGQATVLGGVQASVGQEGPVTTVSLDRNGAIVTISTDLGPQEATRLAASLK